MKKIPLTQGKFAIIDDEDYEKLSKYKWCVAKTIYGGYMVVRNIYKPKHRTIYIHRQIMNCPKGMDVDHRDHNQLDNRKVNLRICTHSQNMQNGMKIKKGSSKYKGITWDKRYKKWVAQITINYKHIHLGYFEDEEQAAKTYDKAAVEYFGEFAHPNFPIERVA